MWLQSIRLREVGHFQGSVSIDGLTPGLNVLSAANEAGKSTVFRAVDVLFREKHTSTKAHNAKPGAPATAATLQPISGGAPRVSCSFSIDGVAWVLTKQFLQQRSAELSRVDGSEILRGDDVDPYLVSLLSRNVGFEGVLPLLWVGQRDGLIWQDPMPTAQATLRGLIEREAREAAGGGAIDDVLADVKRDLDALMTDKRNKPRRNGPLDEAARALATSEAELAEAVAAQTAADARQDEAADLKLQLAEVSNPEAIARLTAGIAEMSRGLDAHVAAAQRFETEQKSVALAARAVSDADRRVAAIVELAGLRERLTANRDQMNLVLQNVERQRDDREAIVAARAAAQAGLAALEAVGRAAEAEARRRAALVHSEACAARLAEVAGLAAEADAIRHRLDANAATAARLAALGDAERRIATLEAQRRAIAPSITIAYEAGGEGRIARNGEALVGDATFAADEAVVLTIAGIGGVIVAPAAGGEQGALLADLDVARAELERLLAEIRVASSSAARQAGDARNADTQAYEIARQRLADWAPDGMAALQREAASAHEMVAHTAAAAAQARAAAAAIARAGSDPSADAANEAVFAQALDEARAAVHARDQQVAVAAETVADLERQLHALQTEEQHLMAVARDRAAALDLDEADAFASIDLEVLAAQAQAGKADAESVHRAAVAERDTYATAKLSDDAHADLIRNLQTAKTELASRQRKIQDIAGNLRACEGAIEAHGAQGLGERLRRAQDEVARAMDRCERLQRRADALVLLEAELETERTAQSSTLIGPIVSRMAELAAPVIGRAQLAMKPDFSAPTVARGGAALGIDRLSGGTQEQIAILSRLAYGSLLAEHGQSLPFVLDDALVYADDSRRRAMFEVLASAARKHQVVVLTCQSRSADELVSHFGAQPIALAVAATRSESDGHGSEPRVAAG